jgi:DNA gyrase subunit A
MLMNSNGHIIRIPAAQISRIGRATQGVTLMRLGSGETVASMAIVAAKSEDDTPDLAVLNGHDVHDGNVPSTNGRTPRA